MTTIYVVGTQVKEQFVHCPYCELRCNCEKYLDLHKEFCFHRPNKGFFGVCADFIAIGKIPTCAKNKKERLVSTSIYKVS